MAQADTLERRRALAAERQRRRRANLKLLTGAAGASSDGALPRAPSHRRQETGPGETAGRVNGAPFSPRVHSTQRLESLGTTPEAFTGVPPATDAPAELVAAPSMDQALAAKKFAALIGFMTKLALDDAVVRYGAAGLKDVPGIGQVLGEDPGALVGAAVDFVKERAERCALKHGFGITIPYEDEVVTVVAGAGSGVYLLRKFTGRLPDPTRATPPNARHEDTGAPPSPDRDVTGAAEPTSNIISLGGAPRGEGFSWLPRK